MISSRGTNKHTHSSLKKLSRAFPCLCTKFAQPLYQEKNVLLTCQEDFLPWGSRQVKFHKADIIRHCQPLWVNCPGWIPKQNTLNFSIFLFKVTSPVLCVSKLPSHCHRRSCSYTRPSVFRPDVRALISPFAAGFSVQSTSSAHFPLSDTRKPFFSPILLNCVIIL